MSHSDRYATQNEHIPYEDQILISPYLAGYGKRAWIDESKNTFMGEIELANNENGRLIKDMLKKGFDVGTSMSVSATANDREYIIDDILSLGDFTLRPDLEAKVVKIDFSEKVAPNGKSNLVTFSQVIKNEDIICDFSEENEVECCNQCGNPLDECTCCNESSVTKGVIHEGKKLYSQSNCERPNVTQPEIKTDIAKVIPVENTQVGQQEVITNLNEDVVGEDIENITPNEYFNSVVFAEAGITSDTNLNVSLEEIHEGIPVEDQLSRQELAQLPNEITSTVTESVTSNFSLQQYITELNWQPYAIYFRRVNEVIQLCRSRDQEWINANIDKLKSYFDSYMMTWIKAALDSDKEFNIALGLRLIKFNVESKKMMRLNRIMKRMRKMLLQTGYISKPIQQEMVTAFNDIVKDIYKFIDDKIKAQGVTFINAEKEEE